MNGIGNDIISLQLINTARTQQERFYSKILCKQEVSLYKNRYSGRFSLVHFVWLAWSVKESVYKFCKKNNTALLFSPTKIIIDDVQLPSKATAFNFLEEGISLEEDSCYCCRVSFNGRNFYARSFITDAFIFTVANSFGCFKNIYWGITKVEKDDYATQSESLRAFALKKLNHVLLTENLSIEKNSCGCPVIAQQKNIPLSFAHHGKFIAYAFELNKPQLVL